MKMYVLCILSRSVQSYVEWKSIPCRQGAVPHLIDSLFFFIIFFLLLISTFQPFFLYYMLYTKNKTFLFHFNHPLFINSRNRGKKKIDETLHKLMVDLINFTNCNSLIFLIFKKIYLHIQGIKNGFTTKNTLDVIEKRFQICFISHTSRIN